MNDAVMATVVVLAWSAWGLFLWYFLEDEWPDYNGGGLW